MNIRHLAAAAALIVSCGSLPAVAAPIYDAGAHYIIKFSAQPDNAHTGTISGQITLSADAYHNGFSGQMASAALGNPSLDMLEQPAGLLSMNIVASYSSPRYGFTFEPVDVRRIEERRRGNGPLDYTGQGFAYLSLGAGPLLAGFSASLNYLLDTPFYYSDMRMEFSGNGESGGVAGSYGSDYGHGFGCDYGEGGEGARCEFSTAYAVSVPEPASLALLGTGLVGLMAMRRRRKSV